MENETIKIDAVNPNHYGVGKEHECIDVMFQQFGVDDVRSFCALNAFKYLFRLKQKGDPVENARKAQWYLDQYILMGELNKTNNETINN